MQHYLSKKQVFFSSIGVICEWYDFCLYIYLGHILSVNFLSHFSADNSQFNYYLIFAFGYIVRPFGGWFFGYYADKKGRKPALLLSIKMLVIVGVLITLLPTYQQIGVLAPIALLVLRGCQGFAMGGEFTAILTMMFENTHAKHQGSAIALMENCSIIGMLLSAGCFFIVSHIFSAAFVLHIGWRLCFLFGSVVLVGIYYIQNHLPESYQFVEQQKQAVQAKESIVKKLMTHYKTELVTGFLIMVALSITYAFCMVFLVNNYLPKYTPVKHLQFLILFGIFLQYPANTFGGYLADKIGAIKTLFIILLTIVIAIYPLSQFLHIDKSGAAYSMIVLLFLVATPATLIYLNRMFPTRIRCLAVFLCYNIANAIFCGLTPSMSLMILNRTHSLTWVYIAIAVTQLLALAALVVCQLKRNPAYYDSVSTDFSGKQNLAI